LGCHIPDPVRDQLPLGLDLRTALEVESPVVEPGLPGTAVELDTVNDNFLVLEIGAVRQELLAGFPVLLETKIMVAGDDDLVGVGQCVQEIVEFPDIIQCPMTGQVCFRNGKTISPWITGRLRLERL